jgi:predicted acyl esterase
MRSLVLPGAAHQQEAPGVIGARPPYPPLAVRPDVLVFQTPPLAEPVEVTGPITVSLWISSSAVDTDFTAKLLDVYPPSEDYPAGYARQTSPTRHPCALPQRPHPRRAAHAG